MNTGGEALFQVLLRQLWLDIVCPFELQETWPGSWPISVERGELMQSFTSPVYLI